MDCYKNTDAINAKTGRDRIRLNLILASALASVLASNAHAQTEVPSEAMPEAETSSEIVVTAGRRNQTVLDVPYNITAVTSDNLVRGGTSNVNDLTRIVPGLVQAEQGPALYGSGNNIVMRGLNAQGTAAGGTTQTVSPVSTYLGNVPIFFPLTLNDLDRVEVLRGPQGTLYGSGSAGGTIRFIPKAPQLGVTSYEGHASLGMSQEASSPNYNINGVVHLPIGSTAALRIVAGYERLAGFIDGVGLIAKDGADELAPPTRRVPGDPNSGFVLAPEQDTNSSRDWFVRSTLRWEITPEFAAEATYHHQRTVVNDSQTSNPFWAGGDIDYSAANFPGSRGENVFGIPGGGLYPNGTTFLPAGGNYRSTSFYKERNSRTVDLGSLDLSYDLGFATVTSTTSYFVNEADYLTDNTSFYINVSNPNGGVPLVAFYDFFPRLTAPTLHRRTNKTFAEELRIASNGQNTIDYVVGAYYSKEQQSQASEQYNPGIAQYASETPFNLPNPQYGDLNWPTTRDITFIDKAIFGEVTWNVTPRLQITGGARVFWQSFTNNYYQAFPICGSYCGDGVTPGQAIGAAAVSSQRSFHDHIIKLNASYDVGEKTKLYATYSEGFRRGGANTVSTAGFFASLPTFGTFQPDLAKNYEIGIKGQTPGRISYTLALFLINWSNFQFEGTTPSYLPAVFNGNKARSRGIELEIDAPVAPGLSVSLGYSFIDAKLTESFEIYDYAQYGFVNGEAPILAISGPKGARLPGSAKHSVTVGVNYEKRLSSLGDGEWTLAAGANGSYRSSILPGFPSSAAFDYEIPATFTANARIALERKSGISVDFAVRNLTNSLARSSGVPAQYTGPFASAGIARPRTFTLGVHYRY